MNQQKEKKELPLFPKTRDELYASLNYFCSPELPEAKTEYIQKYFKRHYDLITECLTDENLKTSLAQKFTVLESIDGVGKSTQINLFKNQGFNVTSTPPPNFFETEKQREAMLMTKNYHLISTIYLGACLYACVHIPKINIIDRFWPSTYAYQAAQYKQQTNIDITIVPKFEYLPNPINIIYLQMPEKLRLKRLSGRNKNETIEEQLMRKDIFFTENIKNN